MEFNQEYRNIAQCAKLLGHPARVQIVQMLVQQQHCISTAEITGKLPLSRSTIMQHLTALREGGLIQSVAEGAQVSYCINTSKFRNMASGLLSFLTESLHSAKHNPADAVPVREKQSILFLCTGNSCRSQMAEAFLKKYGSNLNLVVHSAGTTPAKEIHPLAIEVMQEKGITLEGQYPKSSKEFIGNRRIDLVIFVCSDAEKDCPYIFPFARRRVALPFDDPAQARGSKEKQIHEFRRIRDEIEETIQRLIEEFPEEQ